MFKAIAIKELREVAPLAAAALIVSAYCVVLLTGLNVLTFEPYRVTAIPFLDRSVFVTFVIVLGTSLAIALGLRQSAWESGTGTYLFLLHRPASRYWLMGAKLITGLLVLLATTAAPILAYALWAATPGNLPAPFRWSMTGTVWLLWFAMTIVYLGAFLSGLRPARWYATRLLPLVGIAPVMPIIFLLQSKWMIGVAITILLDAILLAAIYRIAETREYS